MIGLVIATHQDLGAALRRVAEGIVGPMESVETVSLGYQDPLEVCRERMADAVRRAEYGQGVLLLTDMFGGTPTNLSLPFLERGRVEVLAGVNLPLLLKAHTARQEMGVADLAAFLRDYGRRNIVLASDIWGGGSLGGAAP